MSKSHPGRGSASLNPISKWNGEWNLYQVLKCERFAEDDK